MNRWNMQSDNPWITDQDPGFNRLDMLTDRGQLPQGTLAVSINKRLRDGVAITRKGSVDTAEFNPGFENTINGCHVFRNPNGEEVMLVSTVGASYVWACQFNKTPVKINLPGGHTTGTGQVNFIQGFQKVLMQRATSGVTTTLSWDGNIANAFVVITASGVGTTLGYKLIPAFWNGIPFQNRVLLFNAYYPTVPLKDQIIASDVNDFSTYDDILYKFRINAGESNQVAAVVPYFRGSIVVYMTQSIHMLENFTIDPFAASQRLLNNRVGGVGVFGPLQVGNDVHALSRAGGIYRLSELVQEQIATLPLPISREIQPIIDRINWDRAAQWHSTTSLDDYEYYALPLDDDTGGSNVVAVRNSATNQWESIDSWGDPSFHINRLLVTLYNGKPAVFGVDFDNAHVYALYEGTDVDEINGSTIAIEDMIETRGYLADTGFKRFERACIVIRSYEPNGIVTAIVDGVNEEKEIGDISKSPEKFYTLRADFDPNVDAANTPYREDYGEQITPAATQDFQGLPEGAISSIPPTSIGFTPVEQQSLERFQIRETGRWCSARVKNNGGRIGVVSVAVDGQSVQETMRVAV